MSAHLIADAAIEKVITKDQKLLPARPKPSPVFWRLSKAQPDERLIGLVNRAGASVPHVATTLN
jgi:hypothetical protein